MECYKARHRCRDQQAGSLPFFADSFVRSVLFFRMYVNMVI